MRIAVYKEKIKKTIICPVCDEKLVLGKGNQKYHAWCAFDVKRERENSFNRLKTQERKYENIRQQL